MKRIIIIVLYFGKLPNYFNLWLRSCEYNNSIDFMLITDNDIDIDIPGNVMVKKTTFSKIKEIFQSKFTFPISLEQPYKFCDYKPAYGYIFEDIIEPYDFWGHCDLDVIWGDIRKYLTDDVLDQYEKILPRGHLSLYKNDNKVNRRFMEECDSILSYKVVYSSPKSYAFDEWTGIVKLYQEKSYLLYDCSDVADISFKYNKFLINHFEERKIRYFIWYIEKNNIKLLSVSGEEHNGNVKEHMYVHLQKRAMSNFLKTNIDSFLIIPDSFIEMVPNNSIYNYPYYHKLRTIRISYIKYRLNNLKKKFI